jgi:hypothetical protein
MARSLSFSINQNEYPASPVKVDRKKLYGWSETVAIDDNGRECKLVSMDETGTFIIPKGGLGLGVLSPEGSWVDRKELKAVTLSGEDAELMPSSYDSCITLDQKVSPEEFLDYSILSFYQIYADPALMQELGDDIYTFTYNYHAGYVGQQAFILRSEDSLFMLVGFLSAFEMLSLDESGSIDVEEGAEDDEDDDGDIDFSMF